MWKADPQTQARLWGVISAACGIQAAWRFPTDAHRSMDQSAVPSSQHLPQNGCMELQDQVKVAGFREMWQPVYSKYKAFFECAFKLQGIVSEMITSPVHGQLPQIIGQMAAAASNTYGAILTLVLNGFGNDAMKLARSLFEIELNILRLKNHPDDLRDFLDYHLIQQKQLYDIFTEEQKTNVPPERYQEMMAEYNRVLPRFIKDKATQIPRNEWCRDSLYFRAREAGAGYLYLYQTFYRQASSMHHLDIAGVMANVDSNIHAQMAPSWDYLEDALVATGIVIRCASHFNEVAGLGFADRIDSGPSVEYINACRALK